jgi:hypothetical protein
MSQKDIANEVLRGKFMPMSAYTKKARENSNNLMTHLKLRKTRTSQTPQQQMEKNNKDSGRN